MPFRKVLVATDFSDPSRAAADAAARLAPDAELMFVHVLAGPVALPLMVRPQVRRAYEESAGEAASATESRLRAFATEAGRPDARLKVISGSAGREVAAEASAWGADLIVVGATGASGIERVLLGSTARAILRTHAERTPVLVVRGGARSSTGPVFRRVAVATDFHEPSRKAARLAREIAASQGAALVALHVVDPSLWGAYTQADPLVGGAGVEHPSLEEEMSHLLSQFNEAEFDGKAREVLLAGRPSTEIRRFVEEAGVDLVAVGTHGPGALERAILGSVAESMVERLPVSVIVAPVRE